MGGEGGAAVVEGNGASQRSRFGETPTQAPAPSALPLLTEENVAKLGAAEFHSLSTVSNDGASVLEPAALFRSGASENDAFFCPSLATAKRLKGKGPAEGNVLLPIIDGEATARTDILPAADMPAWENVASHVKARVNSVAKVQVKIKREVLKNLSPEQINTLAQDIAMDVSKTVASRLENARRELEKKDQKIGEQDKRIEELSALLAAVQHENAVLKAPKSGAPFAGTFTTPNAAATAETQRQQARPVAPAQVLTPVQALGNLIPHQKRPFQMTPNPADDVFASQPTTPTRGPRQFNPADFEKKQLPELLACCFSKVEAAVRKFPIRNPARDKEAPQKGQFIYLLQGHLGNSKVAYDVLYNQDERHWAIIGMLSHSIVDYVFKDSVLGSFQSPYTAEFTKAWKEEEETSEFNHPKVDDLNHRRALAEQRAKCARTVVQFPGFWKWVQVATMNVTNNIIGSFTVAFAPPYLNPLAQELHKAVDEAMRIAIRMLQDPTIADFTFPPTGTPWNSMFHVHRNPELIGQVLTDDKSQYCVRVACMPVVKIKSFEDDTVGTKVVHRAEVVVGDRKTHLQSRRQRY